jgi:CheY-like chemotaxis protein
LTNRLSAFGSTAKGLARNPLGIIALFIVLVYGLAALVTAFAGSLTQGERLPLIWFLVVFPAVVLGVFAWLVSRHSSKLFAPGDFRDEGNYVKMQMAAVASLTAAAAKGESPSAALELERVVEVVQDAPRATSVPGDTWKANVLWVDDRPSNNVFERRAFEALGLSFTLAESTDEALRYLSRRKFGVIISDMGRREGSREGYALLDRLRQRGDRTPLFFYAGSASDEHRQETREHEGQGCTNNPQELFEMVMRAVVRGPTAS